MPDIAPWDNPQAEQIDKKTLDVFHEAGDFSDGPFLSSFGDGYGQPYNPNRQAGGTLKDGRIVWAWVKGPKSEVSE